MLFLLREKRDSYVAYKLTNTWILHILYVDKERKYDHVERRTIGILSCRKSC